MSTGRRNRRNDASSKAFFRKIFNAVSNGNQRSSFTIKTIRDLWFPEPVIIATPSHLPSLCATSAVVTIADIRTQGLLTALGQHLQHVQLAQRLGREGLGGRVRWRHARKNRLPVTSQTECKCASHVRHQQLALPATEQVLNPSSCVKVMPTEPRTYSPGTRVIELLLQLGQETWKHQQHIICNVTWYWCTHQTALKLPPGSLALSLLFEASDDPRVTWLSLRDDVGLRTAGSVVRDSCRQNEAVCYLCHASNSYYKTGKIWYLVCVVTKMQCKQNNQEIPEKDVITFITWPIVHLAAEIDYKTPDWIRARK